MNTWYWTDIIFYIYIYTLYMLICEPESYQYDVGCNVSAKVLGWRSCVGKKKKKIMHLNSKEAASVGLSTCK